ncbi:dihydropteroate synthase [Nitrososphaera viennensis]|uniref:Dihydropteroate synthase n=1 Tax=Nitrososphaera viennensis TaxID=1034015 RepID=A0A977ID20_9ARCH|nr:dihydropteroate synthase [Nitrososphaera viennensis]UVS68528.1 dihydropteroate synthase [Nitrososphaera viennensis]
MAKIGSVEIGKGRHVKVMGIINASPESFFKGSVRTGFDEVAQAAREMQGAGAHVIDIGAMSTAPYLDTIIPVEEEIRRLKAAMEAAKSACSLPISVDTPRAEVAEAATKLGADAINDVTGLKYDRRMAQVVAKAGLPVIIGAYSRTPASGRVAGTVRALKESIALAKKAGVRKEMMLVDPSIGFFRAEGKNPFFTKLADGDKTPWYSRDLEVLSSLYKLAALAPVCVSVSRKSFIGHLLNLPAAEQRMVPSVACEVVAAINGASLVRTHSVKETVQALTMLELLRR